MSENNVVLAEAWDKTQQEAPKFKQAPKTELDEALTALNSLHAVINSVGGKTVIASWEPSEMDPDRNEIVYQNQTDFNLRYGNRTIAESFQGPGGRAVTTYKPLSKWWLGHRDRKQYSSVVFVPNQPKEVGTCLNIWEGWGVNENAPGDWSLIGRHILEVVAGGNQEMADYVTRWIAWSIQHPDKQAEVALVLVGEKGAGKGTVARVLQRIFGVHSFQVTGSDAMTGKFNNHLHSCILLVADEAFWGGDKKGQGRLQGLITEPYFMVEPKGVNAFQVRNLLHILMLAEPGWVIPAGRHERRYAAFWVSDEHREDKEDYFKPLHKQIEGNGCAAMFYDLRRMPLGEWHPRQIPLCILKSEALVKQQTYSLPPMMQWWRMLLQDGQLPGASEAHPSWAYTRDLIADAKEKFPRLRLDLTPESLRNFLFKSPEAIRITCTKWNTSGPNGWKFPPLAECREAWEAIYGETLWDTPGGEWSVITEVDEPEPSRAELAAQAFRLARAKQSAAEVVASGPAKPVAVPVMLRRFL